MSQRRTDRRMEGNYDVVESLVGEIHLRKSLGTGEVENIALKDTPCEGIRFFTSVINSCIKLQCFSS